MGEDDEGEERLSEDKIMMQHFQRYGGMQYEVAYRGDKVLKTPRTDEYILSAFKNMKASHPERRAKELISRREESAEFIKKGIAPSELFCNPIFNQDGSYLQDRVLLLGDFLEGSTPVQQKQKVNQLVKFYLLEWQYGFSEYDFKIGENYGINSSGHVVLLDLGELVFEKDIVAKNVENKKWKEGVESTCLNSDEIKNYFTEKMYENFTQENLLHHWKIKI